MADPKIVQPLGPRIATGRTAEVYTWGPDQVLKLYYDWCPPQWASYEVAIGRKLARIDLPTPRLLDTLMIDGRQGIIYQRIEGISMLALLTGKPWQVYKLARQLADLHSQVHRRSGAGLPSLLDSLKNSIQSVDSLPAESKEFALNVLNQLPDGEALCHFDFHPAQVILAKNGPVIIDWMTAHQGHPLADVARTTILFKFAEVPGAGWLQRVVVDVLRRQFYRAYLRRYLELNPGYTPEDVHRWLVPVAAARLKEDIPGEQPALLRFIAQQH